jgi:hypothetical protein
MVLFQRPLDVYVDRQLRAVGRSKLCSHSALLVFVSEHHVLFRNRISADDSFLLEIAIPSNVTCSDHNLNCTVLGWMHATATRYQHLNSTGGLADYGENQNLLECVPRYQHCVPSLNAANVWMGNQLADLYECILDDVHSVNHQLFTAAIASTSQDKDPKKEVVRLRKDSDEILSTLMKQYVDGQGIWKTLYPDGTEIGVRTVIDFHTIGSLLGSDLTSNQREEMAGFVRNEL